MMSPCSYNFLTLIVYLIESPSFVTLSVNLTEYLGGGKSESGESEGSIIGTGEQEAETSGESGPSVAELWSDVTGSYLPHHLKWSDWCHDRWRMEELLESVTWCL